MFRLETHHDLISNKKVSRYVTNVLIASQSWLKLFVLFEDSHLHPLYETEILETIRSLNQLEKTILVEVENKFFCLAYEPGNLKTVAMVSLDFIRLRPGYRSFVRMDNSKKYLVVVAGEYLIIMLSQKSKDMGMLAGIPAFEKAPVDVKWNNPDFNFFNEIYYVRILQPFFRDIIDVQLDKNNVYILVKEEESHSIYSMAYNSLKPEDTSETVFKKKYHNLAPSHKMTILMPEMESPFLLFTNKNIYHFSPNNQEPPLAQLPLKEELILPCMKTRLFNRSNAYYKDLDGIYVIKILGNGRMERNLINNVPVKDFCITPLGLNGCLLYISETKCVL